MGATVTRVSRTAMTVVGVVLLTIGLSTALADNADAKGNIRATLDQSIPSDSTPGKLITVGWKLESERPSSSSKSGASKYQPFGAGEVFVRLIGPAGSRPTEAIVDGRGHFSASVRVPSGGVKDIKIGIKGTTINADGTRRAGDYFIPITGPIVTTPVMGQVIENGGLFTEDHLAQWIIFGSFALLLILVIARLSRARRNKPTAATS
ncbi:MAG: hypothetical protein JHC87_08050 [Thermoleophilaceae bacterium]|nr:hypothetical protein [Thermoleophilaceae bacterium]